MNVHVKKASPKTNRKSRKRSTDPGKSEASIASEAKKLATLKVDLRLFMAAAADAVNLADLGRLFPKKRLRSAGYPSLKAFVTACPSLVTIEQRGDQIFYLRRPSRQTEEAMDQTANVPQPDSQEAYPSKTNSVRKTLSSQSGAEAPKVGKSGMLGQRKQRQSNLMAFVQQFAESPHATTLIFDSSLSIGQRKLIHQCANKWKLFSKSQGTGHARVLTISKSEIISGGTRTTLSDNVDHSDAHINAPFEEWLRSGAESVLTLNNTTKDDLIYIYLYQFIPMLYLYQLGAPSGLCPAKKVAALASCTEVYAAEYQKDMTLEEASHHERSRRVQELQETLDEMFEAAGRQVKLYAFGSTVTTLYTPSTDMDLSLTMEPMPQTRFETLRILKQVGIGFRKYRHICVIRHAHVPIVQKNLAPAGFPYNFDLSCQTDGVINSWWLRKYILQYPVARPLVMLVKSWSKAWAVNDPRRGRLNSYAVTLMVLYFLCERGAIEHLPPLQPSPAELATLPPVPEFVDVQVNDAVWGAVRELLPQFFEFYADWNDDLVLSMASSPAAGAVTKAAKGWEHYVFCLEDPFLLDLNVARNISLRTWTAMRQLFAEACVHAKGDSHKLFQPLPEEDNVWPRNSNDRQRRAQGARRGGLVAEEEEEAGAEQEEEAGAEQEEPAKADRQEPTVDRYRPGENIGQGGGSIHALQSSMQR